MVMATKSSVASQNQMGSTIEILILVPFEYSVNDAGCRQPDRQCVSAPYPRVLYAKHFVLSPYEIRMVGIWREIYKCYMLARSTLASDTPVMRAEDFSLRTDELHFSQVPVWKWLLSSSFAPWS